MKASLKFSGGEYQSDVIHIEVDGKSVNAPVWIIPGQPDNTVTFAYIIKVYKEKSPRNFSEARGLVTNDYQNYLEDKWIEELKKKYGVKVDEAVFKSLK